MNGHASLPVLLAIILNCAVMAVWLPLVKIYEHTFLSPFLVAVGCFVNLGLWVLIPVAARTSREWPERLFRWHQIACVGILVVLLLTLFVDWIQSRMT